MRFTAIVACQSPTDNSSAGPSRTIPRCWTRMSIRRCVSRTASTVRVIGVGIAYIAMKFAVFGEIRDGDSGTFGGQASPMAAPIPDAPPVTRATLSSRRKSRSTA